MDKITYKRERLGFPNRKTTPRSEPIYAAVIGNKNFTNTYIYYPKVEATKKPSLWQRLFS
jgi:hypothetical protein